MAESEKDWEVDKILQRGKFNNVIHYLVLWKGYEISEATWEPISNLKNCEEAILEFESVFNTQKKPKASRRNMKRVKMEDVFGKESKKFVSCVKMEEDMEGTTLQQNLRISEPAKEKHAEDFPSSIFQDDKKQVSKFIETRQAEDALDNHQNMPEAEASHRSQIMELSYKRNREAVKERQDENQMEKIEKRIKRNESDANDQLNMDLSKHNIPLTYEPSMQTKTIDKSKAEEPFQTQSPSQHPEIPISLQNTIISNQEINNNKQDLITQQHPTQENRQEGLQKESNNDHHHPPPQKVDYRGISHDVLDKKQRQKTINKEVTYRQEQQIRTFRPKELERYRFLDALYEENQKIYLLNILRKMQGKKTLKVKANMIDITKNPQLLSTLANIKFMDEETSLQKMECLIKQDYGWLAVGKHSVQGHVIMDVNWIDKKCWKVFLEMMAKRREEA